MSSSLSSSLAIAFDASNSSRRAWWVRDSCVLEASPRCFSLGWRQQKNLRQFVKSSRTSRRVRPSLQVRAAAGPSDGVRWWEKDGGPNMKDVHSTQEFVDALSGAGEKLVVVDFYGTWCGSCRALYPKLCKLAAEHQDVEFLKVNFDENKPMCKSLNIKVLPFFHFYRGADGRLDGFSCSLSKLQKLKDAIAQHNTERCSIGPPLGVGNINFFSGLSSSSTSDQPAAAAR